MREFEKPVTVNILDVDGNIVYMKLFDKSRMDEYIKTLEMIAEDYVSVIRDGEEYFYSLSEYADRLMNDEH